MGQERSRTNGTRFGVFYKENLRNDREHPFPSRRTNLKDFGNDFSRRIDAFIAINGSDRASVGESAYPLMTVGSRTKG